MPNIMDDPPSESSYLTGVKLASMFVILSWSLGYCTGQKIVNDRSNAAMTEHLLQDIAESDRRMRIFQEILDSLANHGVQK